jgi:hypothetical protein
MPLEEYGADVSTFPGLNITGTQIDGVRAVIECSLRRLITPTGSLSYDTDFGYDLRDLLHEDLSDFDLARHGTHAGIELEKDERIVAATVTLSWDPIRAFTLLIRVTGVLVDDRELTFTASISEISAEILG